MTHPALAYAETQLGVHTVYDEAVEANKQLDEILGELDKAQDRRRGLNAAIEDRTFDLLIEERGKHADQSATWLDQHMKQVKHRDEAMREYRQALDLVTGEIQGLEYDAELWRIKIKILVARMTQLGGYLNYLAAVKQAETPTTDTTDTTVEDKQ